MVKAEKRLKDIVKELSPEQKAKLMIEDLFHPEPVLPPAERRKMLAVMDSSEGGRYNAVIDRYYHIRDNLKTLETLTSEIKQKLLERDRILWFHRAMIDIVDALAFDPKLAEPLLVNNPNLKPGKPLRARVLLGDICIGVWGPKKRYPVGPGMGVELSERTTEALEAYGQRIRFMASDAKALYRYIVEEARAVGLDVLEGWAVMLIRQVAEHDMSLRELTRRSEEKLAMWEKDGLMDGQQMRHILADEREPLRDCIFPVDDRWALVWDEVEENPETARRVRQDSEDWLPVSLESYINGVKGRVLDDLKEHARDGLGE